MNTDKNKKPAAKEKPAEQKGKEAIVAAKVAEGKDPTDKKTTEEEKKDAEQWRNEG